METVDDFIEDQTQNPEFAAEWKRQKTGQSFSVWAVGPRDGMEQDMDELACLSYKGFTSTPKYSKSDNMYYGLIDGIEGAVIYDSATVEGLQAAFEEAVDDFIDYAAHRDGAEKRR